MELKSAIMLRVLINRFHQGAPEVLLKGLSKEEAEHVLVHTISSTEASKVMTKPSAFLKDIHYSWLQPVLETFRSSLQPMLISALPTDSAVPLSKLMCHPLLKPASDVSREFLLSSLCRKFMESSPLPVTFLPETFASPLALLNKTQLIELIDFLGIYDLAEELRHIVDKVLLKAIYKCLSLKKQHFLRICLHQKEKLKAVKIGLINWKGDEVQLGRLLHRRGLLRLSYALSGQSSDLMWHIIHRLDVGRGQIIKKNYSKKEVPGVTVYLSLQVLNTFNYLKKMSGT
ncbi:MAG: hypothetical protein H0W50_03550 [Parachlamydiaceae bacterium]|nr:hypothetical protein [Parachlamydiaceae bacterium]